MAETLTKKVMELENITNYQAGAIVSKMVIAKKSGTVTHFSFAKGEGLSEHTAPFDAMVYILDGTSKITISGEEFFLKKGETIRVLALAKREVNPIADFMCNVNSSEVKFTFDPSKGAK